MRLPEVPLINPWVLGEKDKPIMFSDPDGALHFIVLGTIY